MIHTASPEEAERGLGGRDVDCAVEGLDPTWPLRLPDGWRLCSSIHYDLRGWYWVLEREGQVIALDTIEDRLGLGRDSLRTGLFVGEGGHASAAVRAAYLTAKRLRKGIRARDEWERIARLALEDPDEYRRVLGLILGPWVSRLAAGPAIEGRPPGAAVFEMTRRLLFVRRFGSPARLAHAAILAARRYAGRILRPTGLVVLIGGPDGSGKSTLAEALAEACTGIFKREARFHWRPGMLPRLGGLLAREQADTSRPHGQRPHAPALSLGVLAYYWLDFCVGGLVRVWPLRLRAGLAVVERGWWDIAVDPRRYRLQVPQRLIKVLGRLAPRYDLALILEAPVEVMLARKAEISSEEMARQTSAWHEVLPRNVPRVYLDASRPTPEVVQEARTRVLDAMEARSVSRLGAGWVGIPSGGSTRWWIPRGPAVAATTALAVHQPMSRAARLAWEAARRWSAAGGFRALPRGSAPPADVRKRLAPHVPPRSTFALVRANHPGRYTALVVDDEGRRRGVAKVAIGVEGAESLAREAAAIETLGAHLPRPLSAPRIIAEEPGLLLLEAVEWRPRDSPWVLEEGVARALGGFFRSGASDGDLGPIGPAHGDCAPWNLLQTSDALVLIDWESAAAALPAFHDVCHWLVQAHVLLGRPSRSELLRGLQRGEGWVGAAIASYAAGAELPSSDAPSAMASYLKTSTRKLEATDRPRAQGRVVAGRVACGLGR